DSGARSRPRVRLLVVRLLHDRRDRARRLHAVAAHYEKFLAAVLVEEARLEPFAEVRPELEDVTDLDRRLNRQRPAAYWTPITLLQRPDVGEPRLIIAARLHPAQVPTVAVRPRDELPIAPQFVRDDLDLHAH